MMDRAMAMAVDYHRAGRLAEAEALYRLVLDTDPDKVDALHLLGLAVRHSGRLEECLTLLGRALQLAPAFLEARLNLANILRENGRPDEAAVQWRRLAALAPDLAMAWHGLGGALRAGGAGPAGAIEALGRAVRLDPGLAEAHHDLGLALRQADRLGEAIDSQRRAVGARPDFLSAQMNLGNLLLDQGRGGEAQARLRRAVALGPAAAECWYNLGNACSGGDPAGALRCYLRAAGLGLGLARTRVAETLIALGRPAEAEAVLLDGLAWAGTDVATAIERLTGILVRAGRAAEGRALFTRLADTPLAGNRYPGECLTALAALDLSEGEPRAAATRLARVQGDNGWFFTVKSLAALQATLAERGLRLGRPAATAAAAPPRITSSSLASRGRFAHNVMEYILLRLGAEAAGCVLETPDWVGEAFFELNDPPQGGPLPPLLFGRRLLNDLVTGRTGHAPPEESVLAGRDILSPLFLFEHSEAYRERVQSWLRPRAVWAPFLDPAMDRLRAVGATVVAIHIRRGDFVTAGYPLTDTGWYVEWLRALWPTLDRPVLYLASDDLAAVRPAFADFRPLARADVAPDWPGLEYLQDFHVLTQADVVGISAASGFSQLAARLNRHARLFVEPDLANRRIRPFQPWIP